MGNADHLFLSLAGTDTLVVETLLRYAEKVKGGSLQIEATEVKPDGTKIVKSVNVRELVDISSGLILETKRNDQNASFIEFKVGFKLNEAFTSPSQADKPVESATSVKDLGADEKAG